MGVVGGKRNLSGVFNKSYVVLEWSHDQDFDALDDDPGRPKSRRKGVFGR